MLLHTVRGDAGAGGDPVTRHNVRHVFPWRRRALTALRVLADGRSYRAIARELRARGLVGELIDPATVRRAVLRVGARS